MIVFRQAEPEDILMLTVWIEADRVHRDRIKPEFFTERTTNISCYAIQDDKGPVIFVRQEKEGDAFRLHTQFPPTSRRRIVKALEQAYPLVAADAKRRGYREIHFETGSIALARVMFAMGFRAELIATL